MSEWELKQLMIDIGKRVWQRGYVAANDGNFSVRINERELLTTATGISKGFMTPEMIIKMSMDGKVISQGKKYRPSSEVKMHIEVYEQRDDIRSVIHAHPPYCTSFAVAGIPLDKCVLPEAIITIGAVPIAPYGTPSTKEIPDSIRTHIQNSDAVLLANHGALTLGVDLITAYHRMETLEHAAHIVALSINLGNVNVIPPDQVDKLMELREKMVIPGRINACTTNPANPCTGSCATTTSDSASSAQPVSTAQIDAITRAVMDRIKQMK
ncbi:class II aldolase/adducin family protein [candidate division KSB1 bacterium]|nr:class II aldolase/adducin family protein [candidate division KSB1 bacterium]